jgi:hypothetical protein
VSASALPQKAGKVPWGRPKLSRKIRNSYPEAQIFGLKLDAMYDKQPSMNQESLSQLRRDLAAKLSDLEGLLRPVFEKESVLPGVVTVSRHRCGNSGCACTREGKLHEAVRILVKFKDGYATRCLSKEQDESFRPRTEAYQRLRKARGNLGKWHKEVIELIDRIERERRSLEGLSEEDRKRPLR